MCLLLRLLLHLVQMLTRITQWMLVAVALGGVAQVLTSQQLHTQVCFASAEQ
jgi:uncharacterized membrane protein YraQ (UPF0718 family)